MDRGKIRCSILAASSELTIIEIHTLESLSSMAETPLALDLLSHCLMLYQFRPQDSDGACPLVWSEICLMPMGDGGIVGLTGEEDLKETESIKKIEQCLNVCKYKAKKKKQNQVAANRCEVQVVTSGLSIKNMQIVELLEILLD